MLTSSNKGETAVHGCHCQGHMVVCMRKVLAIPRSWYVCFSAYFDIITACREGMFHRDRGGGGAGRAAAPPLFCAPAPTFCGKKKNN